MLLISNCPVAQLVEHKIVNFAVCRFDACPDRTYNKINDLHEYTSCARFA